MYYLLCLFMAVITLSCDNTTHPEFSNNKNESKIHDSLSKRKEVLPSFPEKTFEPFERKETLVALTTKVNTAKDLYIHLFVPLCDNENQGIVKVPEKIGNGFDLRNNLYWGAKFGVGNYYHKIAGWRRVAVIDSLNENVLQRLVFQRTNRQGSRVYLVADAYRGDRMVACLEDTFSALAGSRKDSLVADDRYVGTYGKADLIAFSGHNGLMDEWVVAPENTDGRRRDVVIMGCISQRYFNEALLKAGGYPLMMTTNYMAPEAYVTEAIFTAWSNLESPANIRKAAGMAYDKYQKCGVRGATRLFVSGWSDEPLKFYEKGDF